MESRPLSPPWSRTTKITVTVFLLVAFGIATFLFRVALVPILISSITAYILYPPARGLSRLTRLPHALATGLVYLLLLAIIIPVSVALLPQALGQFGVIAEAAVEVVNALQSVSPTTSVTVVGIELSVLSLLETLTTPLIDGLRTLAGGTIGFVGRAAQTALLTVFTLIIGFYLTRDGDRFVAGFISAVPDHYRPEIERLVHQIDHIWQAYFREQLFTAIATGLFAGLLAYLVGLPVPTLMGFLAAFLLYLPGIGSYIWLLIALILAIAAGSTRIEMSNVAFAFVVVGIHVIYTQGLRRLLARLFTYTEIKLHPVVLIVGVLASFAILGILGVILAAPLVATVVVFSRYIYAKLMDENPFQRKSMLMATTTEFEATRQAYLQNSPDDQTKTAEEEDTPHG